MLELTMILGGILLRLVPHLPNFSPISATALFSGTYLKKRYSFILPLVAMAISDYLLLYANPFGGSVTGLQPITAMFHSTTPYVWGSFMISGLIGLWLRKNNTPSNIILAALVASTQFFLITNFGVWAAGAYSRGLDGLLTSYVMGLPFFQWTILGDLFYTGVFFGSYALAKKTQEMQLSSPEIRVALS
jgi:hypothetical protein